MHLPDVLILSSATSQSKRVDMRPTLSAVPPLENLTSLPTLDFYTVLLIQLANTESCIFGTLITTDLKLKLFFNSIYLMQKMYDLICLTRQVHLLVVLHPQEMLRLIEYQNT